MANPKRKRQATQARSRSKGASRTGGGLSANAQWAIIGGGIVAVILVLGVFSFRDASDPGGTGVTESNAWDLPELDGDGRVSLASFDGSPTVVNFFASWCIECDRELPAFREAALALDGDVDFVFINSNETDSWRPMAERHDMLEFTLAKDIAGSRRNGLYQSLGGTGGMPMTAFYDADGQLLDVARGALNSLTLAARLSSLGIA